MQEAWKEVRNEKSDTDWVLFGYEGTTFDLKLVSKGEDGIDELKEDLNPCQIMYGIIRVKDPKTSLPKYVLLHWQVKEKGFKLFEKVKQQHIFQILKNTFLEFMLSLMLEQRMRLMKVPSLIKFLELNR